MTDRINITIILILKISKSLLTINITDSIDFKHCEYQKVKTKKKKKGIDRLSINFLSYIVELLTMNYKKIYYDRRKQEGHKDLGYTISKCMKILHYQSFRIFTTRRYVKKKIINIIRLWCNLEHLRHEDREKPRGGDIKLPHLAKISLNFKIVDDHNKFAKFAICQIQNMDFQVRRSIHYQICHDNMKYKKPYVFGFYNSNDLAKCLT